MKISPRNFGAFMLIIVFVLANIAIIPSLSHADHDEDEYEYEYEDGDYEESENRKIIPLATPTPDLTPPVITIVSPQDGSHVPYETSKIKITARVRDNSDSAPSLSGDGTHSLDVGLNVFPLTATDKAGNVATTSLVVIRDEAVQKDAEEITTNQTAEETSPKQHDSDNDGLTDFEEGIFKTDPLLSDTDGDGISDGDEVSMLLNPLGSGKLFSDLMSSHYAAKDILAFVKSGYVQGFGDGSFGTQKALTRAEAAKLLVRSRNIPISDSNSSTERFSDVRADDWFAPYVASLVSSGIAKGYGDGTFGVHSAITRSEIVKMILMSYGIGTGFEDNSPQNTRFTDLDVLSWQASYVEYAAANNVLSGYSNGAFGPNDFVTRGDAIKILASAKKMLEIPANRKTIAFMDPQARLAHIEQRKNEQEKLLALEQIQPIAPPVAQKKTVPSSAAKITPQRTPTPTPAPSLPAVPKDNSAQLAAEEAARKAAAEQEAARLAAEAAARATAEAAAKAKAEATARAAAEAAAAQAAAQAAAKQQTQTQTRAS